MTTAGAAAAARFGVSTTFQRGRQALDEAEQTDEQGADRRRPGSQEVAVKAVFAVDAGTPPEEARERALAALLRLKGPAAGFPSTRQHPCGRDRRETKGEFPVADPNDP